MSEPPQKPTRFDSFAGDYANLIRDPIREKFAASNRFFYERKIQIVRRFYERRGVDTRQLSWLDAGCGQGDMLRVGQPYFASVEGCDPSSGMLQACPDLRVRQQPSVDRVPFDERTFDLITAVCVYHHVPEERRLSFTREALRVLRPGGIFCVIEHNPLNPVTRLIVSRTPVDAGAPLLRARTTRGLLASAGMKILETQYFLFLPERLHKHAAWIEDLFQRVPMGGQYCVFATCGR